MLERVGSACYKYIQGEEEEPQPELNRASQLIASQYPNSSEIFPYMDSSRSTLLDGLCPSEDRCAFEKALRDASQDYKDPIYNELWHACAGPHVNLPTVGEKVVYFPQGHLEQVKTKTIQESSSELPVFNLPYQISCTVICVKLKIERETDEVFAEVTLLPNTEENSLLLRKGFLPSMPKRTNACVFSEVLTTSDMNDHGGFSMCRLHAEECFPLLDMTRNEQEQELVTKDLHGEEWRFRHIYGGEPQRHLLTNGWNEFMLSKNTEPGDNVIFVRSERGECRIGIRHSRKSRYSSSMSILTSRTMQFGIIASAYHALSTRSMFTVDYRPRSSPSEFIIPYSQYITSIRRNIAVGGVFRLRNDNNGFPEESLTGTIVGIEEIDPQRWHGSIWRCLKIRWVGPYEIALERKISPWEVVPLATNDSRRLRSIFRYPRLYGILRLRSILRNPRQYAITSLNPGVMSLQIFMDSRLLSHKHVHKKCMIFGVDLNKISRSNIPSSLPSSMSSGEGSSSVQQREQSSLFARSCIKVHKSVVIRR